jgi:hypothetical protein
MGIGLIRQTQRTFGDSLSCVAAAQQDILLAQDGPESVPRHAMKEVKNC